jgi:quinolinate synthase
MWHATRAPGRNTPPLSTGYPFNSLLKTTADRPAAGTYDKMYKGLNLMPISEDTIEATYLKMSEKLKGVVPDFELRHKAELAFEINRLKEERGAVILGHNYMEPALFHSVPDYTGDSLELSRKAAQTHKDPIVFCGVRFMAETAKILNPDRTVLLPSLNAGCSLAASITAEDVRRLREQFPGVPVVTYVNTYADVKAESDVCCTSSNAVAVIEALKSDTVIFLPDEYLAKNVAKETGKHIIFPVANPLVLERRGKGLDYTLVGWHGKCEVHEKFSVEDIERVREQFPDVVVLAHPECSPEVVAAADFSGSTSAMIKYVEKSQAPRYLLLTECSMGDNIAAENPEKDMLRLCSVRCPHMNQITLEDTLASLRYNRYVIEIPEHIRVRAKRAVDRMLEISGK